MAIDSDLLKKFSEAHGISGHEDEVRSLVAQELEGYGEFSSDGSGSLFCTGGEAGPRVMLTALLLINGIICALLPFILPAVVGRGGFEIYLNVAQNISLVMLLPLALALAARRFYPRAIAWPRKLKDVTFGIWVVILVLIAANASYDISSREGISERVLEQIGVIALLVCGVNFGLGYLLGGRTRAAECSQALGQKNTTLSIYLALTYASPIAALGPTFYVLWHNLWNAWQLYRASERKRRDG